MAPKSSSVRRTTTPQTDPIPPAPATPTRQSQHVTTSPFLPTPLEALLLAIYPATLLLGSLFSLLNPPANAAPYSYLTQSHPPEHAPSYFAQKRNIFNVFFVKIGWFWTTFAFLTFLFLHPSTGPSKSLTLTPRRGAALLRWSLVTAWWWLVTQWAFGPGLIDRGFRLTGGMCDLVSTEEGRAGMSDAREFVTAAACKIAGGKWRGGHDISGHVFLLVLGSGFLWMEILPVVLRYKGLSEQRVIRRTDGGVGSAAVEAHGTVGEKEDTPKVTGGLSAPIVVAALSWWMLLMTAAYFHTWIEKFTGLIVAFMGIGAVYFAPRAVPAMRAIIGMPGL